MPRPPSSTPLRAVPLASLPPLARGPVRVVLGDLVTPEFHARKPPTEFPLGLDCLAQRLRQVEGVQLDLCFLPAAEERRRLDERGARLQTLGLVERHPVAEAQVLALNMMNHLQTPELLLLLDLAGIPRWRRDRGSEHPLVVIGGHVWPNPLPLSRVADVVVVGEGEEALASMAREVASHRGPRNALLSRLSHIPGCYVPACPRPPVKRQLLDCRRPLQAAGSSWLRGEVGALLLARGCPHGCAFCNSAVVGGRYRALPWEQLSSHAHALAEAGARRVVLVSPVASAWRDRGHTVQHLLELLRTLGMAAHPMSDRPEGRELDFLRDVARAKGKLILAPEASPRIRHGLFRKHLAERQLQLALQRAVAAGIPRVQLYCIVAVPEVGPGILPHLPGGFQGETDEDLRYLAQLACSVVDRLRRSGLPRVADKPLVKLDCMPMIPALGTALAGLRFPSWEDYQTAVRRLAGFIPSEFRPEVELIPALDPATYRLQLLLERSDDSVAPVLATACDAAPGGLPSAAELDRALARHGLDWAALAVERPLHTLPQRGLVTR